MIACGFLAATYAAGHLAKLRDMDQDKLLNGSLVSFIGGIIGARLYFVALNWQNFLQHPEEIFATWLGGLSIHGGIIGGLIAGAIYCRLSKFPFVAGCDLIACVLPLGQAIGRWGNFFNSEAFGHPVPADFPIKLYIPPACRPWHYRNDDYFQPTFLYESVFDLVLFLFLYFYLGERLKRYQGMTFFAYLAAYSIGRLIIEPLRTDSIMFGSLPAPSVVSAVLLLASSLAMFALMSKYRQGQKAQPEQPPPGQEPR